MSFGRLGWMPFCLVLGLACGYRSAAQLESATEARGAAQDEGGASPFEARIAFKSPEAMAIQEVPFGPGVGEDRLQQALARYRNQWTLQLTIGPKPGRKPDPADPFALDIENNGGQWRDRSRNLQRIMFEMGSFIRLQLKDGTEVEPLLVEYQRSFGMGLDRDFLMVFPKVSRQKPVAPPFTVVVREFGQGTGTMRFDMGRPPAEMAFWRVKQLWQRSAEPASN